MKRTWRRRNYFIKKDLQGKYVFNFFVMLFIGILIFTFIFSILTTKTLTVIYEDYNLKIDKTPYALFKEIVKSYWIFLVTAGVIVVIISIFLTHRFAGPIYRFERSIEEMIKGNFSFIIRLRKKDEGKELANLINELNSVISSYIRDIKDINKIIGEQVEDVWKKINNRTNIEEIKNNIVNIDHANERLSDLLSKFKIKDAE